MSAIAVGALEQRVINIGDIAAVTHNSTLIAHIPDQNIENQKCARVADVCSIVRGYTTDIQCQWADYGFGDLQFKLAPTQGVIELHRECSLILGLSSPIERRLYRATTRSHDDFIDLVRYCGGWFRSQEIVEQWKASCAHSILGIQKHRGRPSLLCKAHAPPALAVSPFGKLPLAVDALL